MNRAHMEFCTSADWRGILEGSVLPLALARADLGQRIIEVGPGPGFTTEALSRVAERVTAVEIDPTLVEELRARVDDSKVRVVVGDARATGLAASSFTGAASFHMLHHVPTDGDQDLVFAELFRLLSPGGVLLLADGFDSEVVRQFHEGDTYHPVDPTTLPGRLGRIGFVDVRTDLHELGWCTTASAGTGPDESR